MIPKFTRLEIAIIISILILICSCSPGRWVPGNTMKGHYFSKDHVAKRAYIDSLKKNKP